MPVMDEYERRHRWTEIFLNSCSRNRHWEPNAKYIMLFCDERCIKNSRVYIEQIFMLPHVPHNYSGLLMINHVWQFHILVDSIMLPKIELSTEPNESMSVFHISHI